MITKVKTECVCGKSVIATLEDGWLVDYLCPECEKESQEAYTEKQVMEYDKDEAHTT